MVAIQKSGAKPKHGKSGGKPKGDANNVTKAATFVAATFNVAQIYRK